jgi:hypothetical protein
MSLTRRLALLVGVGALGTVPAGASSPSSSTLTATFSGGTTSVTVNPAVTKALLFAKILPYATDASTRLVWTKSGPTVRYGFGITAGSTAVLDTSTTAIQGGVIDHTGGVRFVNPRNFKALKVSDFRIDLARGVLYATKVNNQPAAQPVPVFTLGISDPKPPLSQVNGTTVATVSGVSLTLTPAAAAALNGALHTDAFGTGGLPFGTATVRAVVSSLG